MRQAVHDIFFEFNRPLEAVIHWMYLDVEGFVTVGLGNLLSDEAAAAALPFCPVDTPDQPADDTAKRQGWRDVHARQDLKLVGHRPFESVCNLRLSDDAISNLVESKLQSNEAVLQRDFPDYPNWPADAQLGLLSMAWALGAGFAAGWPKFTAACRAKDFAEAATECRMNETGNPGVIPRNDADQSLFQNTSKVVKPENGYDPDKLYYPTLLMDVVTIEGNPQP